MADLHRLPHWLGEAAPRRVKQRGDVRVGEEKDAGEVEQQRRVLVGPRVQPVERHEQIVPAHIWIAKQIERRVSRDETVRLERTEQVLRATADDVTHALARDRLGRGRH